MRKRRYLLGAALLAVSVAVAGCGGESSTSGTAATTAPQSQTETQAPETTEGETKETTEAETKGAEAASGGYTAGTYTATAKGNNGDVTVEVTFSDSAMESVTVVEHGETPGISDGALEKIPAQIIEQQSLNIDAVTGATNTSKAILAAVEDCVNQAGGDAAALLAKEAVKKEGVDQELTTEIVVVGAGASGTAAALQAAQSGAEVVVVEMTAAPAGQGTMAGGLFAKGSTQQIEAGEPVDNQWVYNQFIDTGNYQVNGALLSRVIQMSGNTVDWLIENGCQLTLTHLGSGSYYEHTTHPFDTLHGYTEGGTAGITDLFAGELAEDPTVFIEVGNPVDTGKRYEDSHTPADLMPEIQKAVEAGKIIVAESPEEMEEKLGMTHLAETIERYNELCDLGEDRDHFKSAKYLDKLEGTLYAVEITPSVFLGTLGGVEINQYCEVINEEGKALPGLYAAGSDTSGVYGNTYVYFEGGTLGYAYNSGRLAGERAGDYVK